MEKSSKNYERTLAIIKPDGMKYRDQIINKIKESGFAILQMKIIKMSPEQASEFFHAKKSDPNLNLKIVTLSQGPITVMCISKVNAIEDWKRLMGPENNTEAIMKWPNSLRALFSDPSDQLKNAVYGSGNEEDAKYEIYHFFPNTVLEPILPNEDDNRFLQATIYPILLDGLFQMSQERPENPLLWLSNWLLLNNPFQPQIISSQYAPVYRVQRKFEDLAPCSNRFQREIEDISPCTKKRSWSTLSLKSSPCVTDCSEYSMSTNTDNIEDQK